MTLLLFSVFAFPEDGAVPLPVLPHEFPSTGCTEDAGVKWVVSATAAGAYAVALTECLAAGELKLYRVPIVTRDDGGMIVFDEILLQVAVVLCLRFRQKIGSVCFLHEQITDVLFVLEHPFNGTWIPFCYAMHPRYPLGVELAAYLRGRPALQKVSVDPAYYCGLFLIDDQVTISILIIAE